MPLNNPDWAATDPLTFLSRWAGTVSAALNAQLAGTAGRFVAEVVSAPRVATSRPLAPTSQPTPPTHTAPARFTDRVAVNVIDTQGSRHVAAAVLFVAPDHKIDSDGALAFAVRAAGHMASRAGVVIVDIAPGPPSWATHLHSLVGVYPITRRPRGGEAPILVVQPRVEGGAEQYAVWHHLVAAGFSLPTVSVPVRGAAPLKLDLEATYAEACRQTRPSE